MKRTINLAICTLFALVGMLAGCAKSKANPEGREYFSFFLNGQPVSYPHCKIQHHGSTQFYGVHTYVIYGAPSWENNNPAGGNILRLTIHDPKPHTAKTYKNELFETESGVMHGTIGIEYAKQGLLADYISHDQPDVSITIRHISRGGDYVEGEFEGTIISRDGNDELLAITQGKFGAVKPK